MAGGRPSSYTDAKGIAICNLVAEGKSLRKIAARKDMPSKYTILKWLNDFPKFASRYARAREECADHFADEIVEIADKATDPQKARVQIDARKWVAAKLKPQKYGDRVNVAGVPDEPVGVAVVDRPPDETRDQWLKRQEMRLVGSAAGTANGRHNGHLVS